MKPHFFPAAGGSGICIRTFMIASLVAGSTISPRNFPLFGGCGGSCSARARRVARHAVIMPTLRFAGDERGRVTGAEAVVDVDRRDAGGAGVEHRQEVVPVLQDLLGDARDLRHGLAAAEDHFRESAAKGAMVVDLGEVELAERQATQFAQEGVFLELPRAELLQEGPEFAFIHVGGVSIIRPACRSKTPHQSPTRSSGPSRACSASAPWWPSG